MSFINYIFNNFNYFLNFYEEFFAVLFIYNFLKLIIFGSIFELIWPTHFFNKRNNFATNSLKFRSFYENILKIKKINAKTNSLNSQIFKKIL